MGVGGELNEAFMGCKLGQLGKRPVSRSHQKLWPGPQRPGHNPQLRTTNEREERVRRPEENTFATNPGGFAPKGEPGEVKTWSIRTSDMKPQHAQTGKVTGLELFL
jgi:hypothetical protein